MRDPKRIDRIIEALRVEWHTQPDSRLTQLIMNILNMSSDPFYIEDDILEAKLKQYQQRRSKQ